MATPWALTPLRSGASSLYQNVLGQQQPAPALTNSYTVPSSTFSSPISRPSTTYRSTGQTLTGTQPTTSSYSSTVNTGLQGFGTTGTSTQGFGSTPMRSPYSQPTGSGSGTSTSSAAASGPRNLLGQPGAYEQWYAQNASRYNQPTALSSYWQSVQGRIGGQRFQPTTAREAYGQMQSAYSQPGQGMTNAYSVADQLRQQSQGEGVMNSALGYFSGPNNTAQYYGSNRNFFESPGAIEDYYAANGDRFQEAGFGENYAQGILGSNDLTGMFGNRLVGDELEYFRDPLRAQSYSEQLYESGNEGLNKWYDLQRARQQEDLENQMSAMGVFGSGETAEAMYRMREGLAAEQARDMAGLASQADQERRARAGLLMDFSGAAADEELARGGLMLDSAGMGLQLDRDAINRLYQGGQLADASSRYGLDRVMSGGQLARSADDSLFAQGAGMANIGQAMSAAELARLTGSAGIGLSADSEERARLDSLFGAGRDVDQLGLNAQQAELDWINSGANIAGASDSGRLAWLNAGGGAAQTAQQMYEQRERYGFTDPLSAANSMADRYADSRNMGATEQANMRAQAVELLMQKSGLSAAEAERRASEWMQAGVLIAQIAALREQ